MSDIIHTIWVAVQTHIQAILASSGLVGVITSILHFLVARKGDIRLIEMALEMLENSLASSLGDKSKAIFDAILEAMKEVESEGFLTDAEAVDTFVKFVKAVLRAEKITLSATEEGVIHDAVEWLVRLINTKKAPVKMAIKQMSAGRK